MPSVAPTMRPRLSTASTTSGSGLFHCDFGWMPISAPLPTADSTGAFVNTSASGPMPTSRYCDHRPCSISSAFSFIACAEPGTTAARSSPISARTRLRTSTARLASPRVCSSITRSSMLAAKVTPAALMTCRSQGARKYGLASSGAAALLASSSWMLPMRCPGVRFTSVAGSPRSSRLLTVATTALKS